MSLQQNLLTFMRMQSVAMAELSMYSNDLRTTHRERAKKFDAKSEPSFAQTVTGASGAPEEDLFLYSRTGVTLAAGERATYNVFSSTVGYEHIYEWEVVDPQRWTLTEIRFRTVRTRRMRRCATASAFDPFEEHHEIPVDERADDVISGTKPVSQDTLPYTPKDASSNLKITLRRTSDRGTRSERWRGSRTCSGGTATSLTS